MRVTVKLILSYVEASVDAIVTNDNSERTTSCVALGPAGNRQGLVKCFDIETGKYPNRKPACTVPNAKNNTILLAEKMVNVATALTKYERPKTKRDAYQRTVFLEGLSFHFWPFVFP